MKKRIAKPEAQLEADLKAGKIVFADDEEWLDRLGLLQCPMTASILARARGAG